MEGFPGTTLMLPSISRFYIRTILNKLYSVIFSANEYDDMNTIKSLSIFLLNMKIMMLWLWLTKKPAKDKRSL